MLGTPFAAGACLGAGCLGSSWTILLRKNTCSMCSGFAQQKFLKWTATEHGSHSMHCSRNDVCDDEALLRPAYYLRNPL